MEVASLTREVILLETRSWLKTPYRHQASVKGAGADCLGMLRGIFENLYSVKTETPPPYRPNWYDKNKDDFLLRKAFEYLVPTNSPKPGDVLIFRMAPNMAAKHCSVMTEDNHMIHARTGAFIEEISINQWYEKRLVGSFEFPGVM